MGEEEEGITKQISDCVKACEILFKNNKSQISDKDIKKLRDDVIEYRDFLKSALINKTLFKDEEYQKILGQFNKLNHFMVQFKTLDSTKVYIPQQVRNINHVERGKSFFEFRNQAPIKNDNIIASQSKKNTTVSVFKHKLNKTYKQKPTQNREPMKSKKIENVNLNKNQISQHRISFHNKNSKDTSMKDSVNSINRITFKNKSKIKNSFDPKNLFDSNSFAENPFKDSEEKKDHQVIRKGLLNQLSSDQQIANKENNPNQQLTQKTPLVAHSEQNSLSQMLFKKESPMSISKNTISKEITKIDKSMTEFIEFGSSMNYFNETTTQKVEDVPFPKNCFQNNSNISNFGSCYQDSKPNNLKFSQNDHFDKINLNNENEIYSDKKKMKRVKTVPKLSDKKKKNIQILNFKKNHQNENSDQQIKRINFDQITKKKISIDNFIKNVETKELVDNISHINNPLTKDQKDLDDLTSICSKNTVLISKDHSEDNYFDQKKLFNSKNQHLPLITNNFKSKIGSLSNYPLDEPISHQNKNLDNKPVNKKKIISFMELVKQNSANDNDNDHIKKQYQVSPKNIPVISTRSIKSNNKNYLSKQTKPQNYSFQIQHSYDQFQKKNQKQISHEIDINFSFTLPILQKSCHLDKFNFFSQEIFFYKKSNKNNIKFEEIDQKVENNNLNNFDLLTNNKLNFVNNDRNQKINKPIKDIKKTNSPLNIIVPRFGSSHQQINSEKMSSYKSNIASKRRNEIKTHSVNKNVKLEHRVSFRVSSVNSKNKNHLVKHLKSIPKIVSPSNKSNNYFHEQKHQDKFNETNNSNSVFSNEISHLPQNIKKPLSTYSMNSKIRPNKSPDSVFSYNSQQNMPSKINQSNTNKKSNFKVPMRTKFPLIKKVDSIYNLKNDSKMYNSNLKKNDSNKNNFLSNLYKNEASVKKPYTKIVKMNNDTKFDLSNLSSRISNITNLKSESFNKSKGSEIKKKRRIKLDGSDSYSNNFNQYYAISKNQASLKNYKFKENVNYLNKINSNRYKNDRQML